MGSWQNEQKLVETTLNNLGEGQERIIKRLTDLEINVGILKAKAGMIGAVSGLIAGSVVTYLLKG
jgi:hypothetical protein